MPLSKPEHARTVDEGNPAWRRARLRASVHNLAVAIARGECTPSRVELEALAQLCAEQWLPAEAARVRRWMAR